MVKNIALNIHKDCVNGYVKPRTVINTNGRTTKNNINYKDYAMSRLVDKLILAGLGSGCLLFTIGTLTRIPPLSVFGFLASTGAGSVSYIVKENSKKPILEKKDEQEKLAKDIASIDPKILVKDIFSNDFYFKIPSYQRPYAWTIEETATLLDDFLEMIGDDAENMTQIYPYFLGTILLIQSNDTREYQVVDGQQRLITLTILLSVLRYLMNNSDFTQYIYYTNNENESIHNIPRLYLRERDQDFFARYIQKLDGIENLETIIPEELSDSQKNIFNNAKFLLDQIKNKLPQQFQKQRLIDFVLNQCFLGIICTSEFEAAYRIFSVLNDRGLELSITDILKADLIGAISQDNLVTSQDLVKLQNRYTKKWENLEEKLGREDFTKLFSHIRMIYQKNKLRRKTIEEFRVSVLTKINNTPEFIDEILEPFADAFYKIKYQTFQGNIYGKEINQLFKWLNRIDNQDWYPCAILYLKKYGHQPEKILEFFTSLERLAAGLMIMKANINRRIKRYSEILNAIENEGDLYKVDSPLQLSNLEKQDIINILNGNIYQMGKTTLYILLRLDTFLSDGIPNYDEYPKITIEHILPQNPSSNSQWNQWFSTAQQREKYVHCLGNLVLLSRKKNSAAQNYEFTVKKDRYINNPIAIFALTIQAIQEKTWTPEVIEKRQRYLLSQLQNLWSLTLWEF